MKPAALSPEQRLGRVLARGGGPLALAESCTGGLVAHRVTNVPGSSAYFDRGLIVYSNRAKVELLGMSEALIAAHGAVSEACAQAMLKGLFDRTPAQIAAAVTGIAGPSGGTAAKPVGTVWIAWGRIEQRSVERLVLTGSRSDIKHAAADAVLHRLTALVEKAL